MRIPSSFHLVRALVIGAFTCGIFHLQAADMVPDETFDFGSGKLGGSVQHTFHLKNSGKETLTVASVASSCSCTKVLSFSKKIEPGKSGLIQIETQLDRTGDKQVFLTATLEGTTETRLFLIKGSISEPSGGSVSSTDLFVEPKDFIPQSKAPVTYVDVRPSAVFDQAHVPGAMNMALFGLNTRIDLKAQNLVVIGSGVDDQVIGSAVEACRQAGFTSIHVLRGGVRLWQQSGGRLVGVFWQNPPIAQISADQLFQSLNHDSWLLLVPRSASSATKLPATLQAKVMVYDDPIKVEGLVSNELAATGTFSGVAVFPESDQDRETLSRQVPQLNRPLFVVQEKWVTFTSLATTQLFAKEATTKTVTSGPLAHSITSCPTCP